MKARYIAAGAVTALSAAITPVCIEAAYNYRGYEAYGGEYLVLPMGVMAAAGIISAAGLIEEITAGLKKRVKLKKERLTGLIRLGERHNNEELEAVTWTGTQQKSPRLIAVKRIETD